MTDRARIDAALRALLPTDEWVRRYHTDPLVRDLATACARSGEGREVFLDLLAGALADDRASSRGGSTLAADLRGVAKRLRDARNADPEGRDVVCTDPDMPGWIWRLERHTCVLVGPDRDTTWHALDERGEVALLLVKAVHEQMVGSKLDERSVDLLASLTHGVMRRLARERKLWRGWNGSWHYSVDD